MRPQLSPQTQRALWAPVLTLVLLLGAQFALASQVFAANTVVTPSALDGWAPANVRTDGTVAIDSEQPRDGLGSLKFTTDTVTSGQDKADYEKIWGPIAGRTLGDLSALSFEFYRDSSSTTAAHFAPALRLYYLTPGGDSGLLIWEPIYNGFAAIPTDTWIAADIFSDNFWMRAYSPGRTIDDYNVSLAEWIANTDEEGSPIDDDADADAPHVLGADTYIVGINVGVGSGWGAKFKGFVDNVVIDFGGDAVSANFEIDPPCTTVCYADAVSGNDANTGASVAQAKQSIQAAIDAVQAGGEVRVLPGSYNEAATNRFVLGSNGPHQFGLFIADDKDGISVIGVDGSDNPITDYNNVLADITTNATNNFGASGIFVEGDNVTVHGLKILDNVGGNNKTFEIIGDNFSLLDSHIAVSDGGSVYFGDWRFDTGTDTSYIQGYTITGNFFDLSASLDLTNGAGFSGPVNSRQVTNNKFVNDQNYPSISFSGSDTGVPWYVYSVGGAIITGNDFTNTHVGVGPGVGHIRARGTYNNSEFNWASYWNDNTFNKAVVALVGAYPAFDVRTYSYPNSYGTFNDVRRIGAAIQAEVDNAQANDTVLVNEGTYVEQVVVDKTLDLIGEDGKAATFIQAPATMPPSSSADSTIVKISGSGVDVELAGFTVTGPGPSGCGSILAGIFVLDDAHADIHDNTVQDIRDQPFSGCQNGLAILVGRASFNTSGTATIKDNLITGYQKNGITVNHTGSDATIEDNTVTGVGPSTTIAQNGIQISSGATGQINRNTVSGHSWTPFTYVSTNILIYGANVDTKDNTLSEGQVGLYHIDGNGTHDGNEVDATSAGTGSPGFWGIIVDDPPANRLPSPMEGTIAADDGLQAASVNAAYTVLVTNNRVTSDNSSGGVGVEADGGYGSMDIDLTAHHNQVNSWEEGVVVYQCTSGCTGTSFTNLDINRNDLANNTNNGMINVDAPQVNGECNWWGDASGPSGNGAGSGTAASGDIDFDPWLLSSDLDGACVGPGLTIVKVVQGAAPTTDWEFTGDLGSFTINRVGGSENFGDIDSGSVTVTETPKPGYLVSVSCSNGDTSNSNSITLALSVGQNVSCNFINKAVGVNVIESDAVTDVAEGSTQPSAYDISLRSKPLSNVTVNILPNAQVTVDHSSVTFTPANWQNPKRINIRAVDDNIVEADDYNGLVDHTVASSDPLYNDPDAPFVGNGNDIDNNARTINVLVYDNDSLAQPLLVSTNLNGNLPGLGAYRDEDILYYDPDSDTWAVAFDGSDVGVGNADVDAFFVLSNNEILMSFDKDFNLAGYGQVDDADVLKFTATSLGANSAGAWSLYFDGSAYGLDTTGEDIDAISVLDNSDLVISVVGAFNVPPLSANDEDLLRWDGSQWSLYFDGSPMQFTASSEDVTGLFIDGNDLYLSTFSNFKVKSDNNIAGKKGDIFICTANNFNPTSNCTFRNFWNAHEHGLQGRSIDGFHVGNALALPAVAAADANAGNAGEYEGDDVDEAQPRDATELPDDMLVGLEQYLPMIMQ